MGKPSCSMEIIAIAAVDVIDVNIGFNGQLVLQQRIIYDRGRHFHNSL